MAPAIAFHPFVLELLSSRLCHDLISPVTAINNGVELVTEMGAGMEESAMQLIGNSARQAAGRLEFFRAAIGAAGGATTLSEEAARTAAETYFAETKITLEWPPTRLPPALMDRPGGGKLVLNLLAVAAEGLPRGGVLSLTGAEAGAVTVTAAGTGAHLREGVSAALAGETPIEALDSRLVFPYVSGALARHYALSLTLESAAEPIMLRGSV